MSGEPGHPVPFGSWALALLLGSVLAYNGVARAQAASLPLQGYFRAGRYMPIEITGGPAATLAADGALPTRVDAQPRATIVPLLTLDDELAMLHCGPQRLPLRPLAPGDALLAAATDLPPAAAAALLPGRKIIAITIDPTSLLAGAPAAWETIDALVLDQSDMRHLGDARRSTLLSAGTVLAAIGPAPPDAVWPWQRLAGSGDLWVLRHAPAGPAPTVCGETAYLPTLAWTATWPALVLREIVAAGVGVAILVVAAAVMLPGRRALVVIAVVCAAAAGGAALWRRALGPVTVAGGDVLVVDAAEQLAQRDAWIYQRGRSDAEVAVGWAGSTHPLLVSPEQADRRALAVHVDADGRLQFTYRAAPGATLALMRRDVTPAQGRLNSTARPLGTSPMAELVRQAYLAPGVRVAGEVNAPPGRWPSIVLGR